MTLPHFGAFPHSLRVHNPYNEKRTPAMLAFPHRVDEAPDWKHCMVFVVARYDFDDEVLLQSCAKASFAINDGSH